MLRYRPAFWARTDSNVDVVLGLGSEGQDMLLSIREAQVLKMPFWAFASLELHVLGLFRLDLEIDEVPLLGILSRKRPNLRHGLCAGRQAGSFPIHVVQRVAAACQAGETWDRRHPAALNSARRTVMYLSGIGSGTRLGWIMYSILFTASLYYRFTSTNRLTLNAASKPGFALTL